LFDGEVEEFMFAGEGVVDLFFGGAISCLRR